MTDRPTEEDALARLSAELLHMQTTTADPPHRIRVQQGDTVIEAEWPQYPTAAPAPVPQAGRPAPAVEPAVEEPADADDGVAVRAPLLGTFYRSPSPGAAPFVEPGDAVEAGQQVAIVEAMKLLNSVVAETAGVVRSVLVDDAETIEFGQPLLVIDPAGPGTAPEPARAG